MSDPKRAEIIQMEGGSARIEVMYNPTTLTLGTKVEAEGEGSDLQFSRLSHDDFSVELMFDTYLTGSDVRSQSKAILALTTPSVSTGTKLRPPRCTFQWNEFAFTGLIIHVQQHFTMFLASGVPVRERMTLTMTEMLSPKQEQKNQGKPKCLRELRVTSGDRIDLIAARTLKDPAAWRSIATINGIADPLTFPGDDYTGRKILIPDLLAGKPPRLPHG